jgi:hypothetical protein
MPVAPTEHVADAAIIVAGVDHTAGRDDHAHDFAALLDEATPRLTLVAELFGARERALELVVAVWAELVDHADAGLFPLDAETRATQLLLDRLGIAIPIAIELGTTHPPGPFLPSDDRWAGWALDYLAAWTRLPRSGPLSAEDQATVVDALGRLPTTYRLVIALRDAAGIPLFTVAQLLGLLNDEARALLHRARNEFEGILDQSFGASGDDK